MIRALILCGVASLCLTGCGESPSDVIVEIIQKDKLKSGECSTGDFLVAGIPTAYEVKVCRR